MSAAGWRDKVVGPRREWHPVIERCGTTHTPEGWERRKLRDKARQRARIEVSQRHYAEFHALLDGDDDRRYGRKYARALRVMTDRHRELYAECYRAHLALLGYESHACSASSTGLRSGSELSGPGAVGAARDLPEPPVEGSEMTESTCSPRSREAEAV